MGFSKDIQSSKLKKEIKEMYKEILGVKKINDEDNFFSLGGNSLNMIQLSNKLFENYEYQLDFAEFLENSDVSYIFVKLIDFLIKEQGD